MTKTLSIKSIRIDGDTQSRVAIDESAVAEYAEAIAAGNPFEPVTVHFDGVAYWLSDGFHRFHAHRKLDHAVLLAEVIEGTVDDARWYASGANVTHGLRRTDADKRRAVEMALRVHADLSDRVIADHCYVSPSFVGNVRKAQVSKNTPETAAVEKRVGKDGVAQTANKRKAPPPPVADTKVSAKSAPTATSAPTALYTDCVGRAIPAYLNPLWYGRIELMECVRRLRDIREMIVVKRKEDEKVFQRISETTLAAMKKIEQSLEDALPYALCPVCQGEGCDACKETGFVSKLVYDTAIDASYKGGAK